MNLGLALLCHRLSSSLVFWWSSEVSSKTSVWMFSLSLLDGLWSNTSLKSMGFVDWSQIPRVWSCKIRVTTCSWGKRKRESHSTQRDQLPRSVISLTNVSLLGYVGFGRWLLPPCSTAFGLKNSPAFKRVNPNSSKSYSCSPPFSLSSLLSAFCTGAPFEA